MTKRTQDGPRRACIRGVLKVHVEVKGLKIRSSVLCLTCSTLYDFKRPCVRRIIGAGRAQNVGDGDRGLANMKIVKGYI